MITSRILLADDHPLMGRGLSVALRSSRPNIQIDCVESIADAEDAVRKFRDYRLVLLDYHLPDSDGFSGMFRMQLAVGKTPIALFSAIDDPAIIATARAVGAAGFLTKSQPPESLMDSIDHLLLGKTLFPATVVDDMDIKALESRVKTLSQAQMRVLAALVKGHLNKQIAGDLMLSEATVKAHMTAIFRKLGVHNRVQAVLTVRTLFAA